VSKTDCRTWGLTEHFDAETATATSPRREFTYRQIFEAANILANHLVKSGIEKGDVVMVGYILTCVCKVTTNLWK
jgi:acyl-coenzyme A synthetase/AMP-(fatty) acid ligase